MKVEMVYEKLTEQAKRRTSRENIRDVLAALSAPESVKPDGVAQMEPKIRIEGCRHTVQRMLEWIDEGACPICFVATAGMQKDKVERARSELHDYFDASIGERGTTEIDRIINVAIHAHPPSSESVKPVAEPVAWIVWRDTDYESREFFFSEEEARANACLGVVNSHVQPLYKECRLICAVCEGSPPPLAEEMRTRCMQTCEQLKEGTAFEGNQLPLAVKGFNAGVNHCIEAIRALK